MAKKQPLPDEITLGEDGRYYKDCPKCGKQVSYLRRNYAIESHRCGKTCKKCSSPKNNINLGFHRGVRISWYNKFETGALTRGLAWEITIDDVADLWEQQEQRCALTDLLLEMPIDGRLADITCSIDRIDSDKGYVRGNIQLVCKDINMSKQTFGQTEFLEMCLQVALTHYNLASV